jgi:SAM-dependent methyltransferase
MNDEVLFNNIARYYDLLYGTREDDLDLWLNLAEEIAGPVLEIGCGTGRVTIPLLQAGYHVTGIDIAAEAIQAAQAKFQAGGFQQQGQLHQADMRNFDLAQKDFAWAFIPINTFMHCQTLADQQATLRAVAMHLKPGGTLVIDLFHPTPQMLLESDGELVLEQQIEDDLTGHTIYWFVSRRLQLADQCQEVTFLLDEIMNDGTMRRDSLTFSLRYLHHFEMTLLLNNAGFQISEILGNYDGSSFDHESHRMIFIAAKI